MTLPVQATASPPAASMAVTVSLAGPSSRSLTTTSPSRAGSSSILRWRSLAGRLPGLVVILSQHLTRHAGPGTVLATVEAADRFLQRREANTVACGFAAGTKSGRCFLPVAPHGVHLPTATTIPTTAQDAAPASPTGQRSAPNVSRDDLLNTPTNLRTGKLGRVVLPDGPLGLRREADTPGHHFGQRIPEDTGGAATMTTEEERKNSSTVANPGPTSYG